MPDGGGLEFVKSAELMGGQERAWAPQGMLIMSYILLPGFLDSGGSGLSFLIYLHLLLIIKRKNLILVLLKLNKKNKYIYIEWYSDYPYRLAPPGPRVQFQPCVCVTDG